MFISRQYLLTRLRRPWAVWLALCMVLLGALAPTVSHALVWAHGEQAPLIEICTSVGPRWMALSTASEPVPSDPATTMTNPSQAWAVNDINRYNKYSYLRMFYMG